MPGGARHRRLRRRGGQRLRARRGDRPQLWKTDVDDFPVGRISGSPTSTTAASTSAPPPVKKPPARAHLRVLQVPRQRRRARCRHRQADAGRPTRSSEPKPTKKNAVGTQLWGPSGAPVWATPAIDAKLNRLYVTTGNNYSDPTSTMSDAFLALDLDTGKILWSQQMTEKDAYTAACRLPDKTNCADSNGPDFDFGSSPILVTLANGRRMLVAGQKSGIVHALDPDKGGEVLWQTRVGRGGTMGGVQWGSAADQSNIYVALSDIGRIMLTYSNSTDADPKQGGGMFALRLEDGERVWYTPPPGCGTRQRCSPASGRGQRPARGRVPGVGGRAQGGHPGDEGRTLGGAETKRTHETGGGARGGGGAIEGPGPAIGGGMVLFNSWAIPTAGGKCTRLRWNVLLGPSFQSDGQVR